MTLFVAWWWRWWGWWWWGQKAQCPKGHDLVQTTEESESRYCDICSARYAEDESRWYCDACHYDACLKHFKEHAKQKPTKPKKVCVCVCVCVYVRACVLEQ